jgi:hypothetical protein
MKYTKGPLKVIPSKEWPFVIVTYNANGEKVFSRGLPCHSSKDKTFEEALSCVNFSSKDQEECSNLNKQALADEILRASAPELLEALKSLVSRATYSEEQMTVIKEAKAVIAKAEGE